jgi:hypothetical protein
MGFARGDVGDLIISIKNHHRLSYRRYGGFPEIETSKNPLSRDFGCRSIFDFCNSIGTFRTLARCPFFGCYRCRSDISLTTDFGASLIALLLSQLRRAATSTIS